MRPVARVTSIVLVIAVSGCGPSQPAAPSQPAVPPPAAMPASPSRVETRSFASAALGVDKDYVVYLPAGYDDDQARRWPVFYYLHGLMLDETSWTELGGLAETADKLGLRAIVVMPNSDDGFYTDATADYDYRKCLDNGAGLFLPGQPKHRTCVEHRRYETYIIADLIRHVDATYRTIAARDGRAIAGLSMGGFGALKLGLRHKDLFAAAASHSGIDALLYRGPHPYVPGKADLHTEAKVWNGAGPIALWVLGIFGPDIATYRAHDPAALVASLAPGDLALYLDCGGEDGFLLHDGMQYLHELLVAKQIEHAYYLGPGGHDFAFWKARLSESLAFLTAHVAPPRP